MFKRIQYSILKNLRSFTYRTVILAVLLTFFIASLLIGSLADIYDTIFTGNVDLTVEVTSMMGNKKYSMMTAGKYLQDEQYVNQVYGSLKDSKGITYTDMDVTLNGFHPLIPSSIDGDTISFFSRNTAESIYQTNLKNLLTPDPQSLNNIDVNPIEGVNNANPQNFYQNDLRLFSGRLFEQQEIDAGELVCVIPFASGGLLVNGKDIVFPSEGDDFSISTYQVADGKVIDHLTWKLKIIGMYQQESPGSSNWAVHGDATNLVPVYVPYQTLQKMQEEAVAFHQKYDPAYLNESRVMSWATVNAMEFSFKNLASLNSFIKKVQESSDYQAGNISYVSKAGAYGSILSSIYTMTDSFRMIAMVMLVMTISYSLLLICLNCVYRRKEIVILQSMGEKRNRINLQFLMEQGISLFIAALISIPAALAIAKYYGVYLFTSNVKDDGSALAKAIKSTLIGKHLDLTADEISAMVKYSPGQIAVVAAVLAAVLVCSYLMIRIMTKHFHARELLNGEE
jgi:cell division protein FtsX